MRILFISLSQRRAEDFQIGVALIHFVCAAHRFFLGTSKTLAFRFGANEI